MVILYRERYLLSGWAGSAIAEMVISARSRKWLKKCMFMFESSKLIGEISGLVIKKSEAEDGIMKIHFWTRVDFRFGLVHYLSISQETTGVLLSTSGLYSPSLSLLKISTPFECSLEADSKAVHCGKSMNA